MNKRVALATALAAIALSTAQAGADVMTVTGKVEGLDITQTTVCESINLTLVVNRTTPADQVEGTKFVVQRLANIDLTKQSDWDAVKGMDVDKAIAAPKAGLWEATTDAEGKAVINGLPIGAYLVTAEVPHDGHHLTPLPFVITLPTGTDQGWNCAPVINAKFEPVPPTTTPTTTKPEFPPFVPPVPGTPGEPGNPPRDSVLGISKQPNNGRQDQVLGISRTLASTGAAVIGVVGLAAAMLVVGLVLVRRRKNEDN